MNGSTRLKTQRWTGDVMSYPSSLCDAVADIVGEDIFIYLAVLGHEVTPFVDGGALVTHDNPGFYGSA